MHRLPKEVWILSCVFDVDVIFVTHTRTNVIVSHDNQAKGTQSQMFFFSRLQAVGPSVCCSVRHALLFVHF